MTDDTDKKCVRGLVPLTIVKSLDNAATLSEDWIGCVFVSLFFHLLTRCHNKVWGSVSEAECEVVLGDRWGKGTSGRHRENPALGTKF